VVQYGPPTTPVGSFPQGAGPYGVLDRTGNVWEWTSDWYKPYLGAPYKTDRYGETYRVLRGGAWSRRPINARAAYRANAPQRFGASSMACGVWWCRPSTDGRIVPRGG